MTATTLQRLLKYPHSAVFDKAPAAELAFRLRHAQGARWTVAEEVMTAVAGTTTHTYDLAALTFGQLVAALQDDGFQVLAPSPLFSGLSAVVLVEGSGNQADSDGDAVFGFTSLLWVLLSAYAKTSRQAAAAVLEALSQMVITQAEGEWLDLWGLLYATVRLPGETDAHYSDRIPTEAFRLRLNAHAIEKTILDATGWDVRIRETWQDVFTLDQSLLSGPDKLYDGETIGPYIIQPETREAIDWDIVKAIIDRNRAAGIVVLGPNRMLGGHVQGGVAGVINSGLTRFHERGIAYTDRALLDYTTIEETSIPNNAARHRREILRLSESFMPGQTWGEFAWTDGNTWATTVYVVRGKHSRDYRVYFLDLHYRSQTWALSGDRVWAPDETWGSVDAIFHSKHSRES